MIQIRLMTAADVSLGMRLKSQAGWNQAEADWGRFLEMQPDGCFVAELDSTAVGTTVTCIFGRVAWVAMVLVDEVVRGRGVGTALLRHAVAFLERQGVPSVRLDATSLGQPVYEKLGFAAEYTVARYEGVMPDVAKLSAIGGSNGVRPAAVEDQPRIIKLDQEVTGADRGKFLASLCRKRLADVRLVEQSGRLTGYLAVRTGSSAMQIGPCIAPPEAAAALITDAAARFAGQRAYLDVPQQNAAVTRIAEMLGLSVQRTFVRMGRGPRVGEDSWRLAISSGPELG